ncbi:uncharacterized protein EI97DRAFT_136668 [Westerdykella ornata]|uniref:Uncharacterized protein n=1 Tax=Westerdykella ornata TaxID=318751 RepID=A0A6A6JCY0_WESOR|nr:uncharacterized protein EI97DRAFT_136668 [Westerdykella ornata]KAF2274125.1 hypothetical protein EI97DRAFT_136668 [Westerdykella ornata]
MIRILVAPPDVRRALGNIARWQVQQASSLRKATLEEANIRNNNAALANHNIRQLKARAILLYVLCTWPWPSPSPVHHRVSILQVAATTEKLRAARHQGLSITIINLVISHAPGLRHSLSSPLPSAKPAVILAKKDPPQPLPGLPNNNNSHDFASFNPPPSLFTLIANRFPCSLCQLPVLPPPSRSLPGPASPLRLHCR